MTENKVSVRLRIEGRVQGVFFRAETKKEADRKGICGWVRNERDGTVAALFEGEKKTVDEMIKWCRMSGPPFSKVTDVDVSSVEPAGHGSFEITY